MKTISATAGILGVDATTVSRRLKKLCQHTGTVLFIRHSDSTVHLTPIGQTIADQAERMERHSDEIGQALGEEERNIFGTVRITSVPIVVNRILIPALPALLKAQPGLTIELLPDSRNLNLTHREADLAIRLARPVDGGLQVTARRIGFLAFAVYAAKESDPDLLDWINFDDTMAHLPQSKWLASLLKNETEKPSELRVADAETAYEAVAYGLGKAPLPSLAARHDPRLKVVELIRTPPAPLREVWVLTHANQRKLKTVQAVVEWISTLDWSLNNQ